MIQRMLAGGLIAGFAAGLLAALLHFAFLQKIILLAEDYESGALVHVAGTGGAAAAGGHAHGAAADGHDHGAGGAEADAAGQGLARNGLTVLFTGLTYASYGLLLVAAFALAERFGHRVDARQGVLWGLCAYLGFQLAPAMGLPPELPGTPAADLTARQTWYFATVAATLAGLVLLLSGRGLVAAMLGGGLIAAPHALGAPHPAGFSGVAPPELAAAFAARALAVGLVAWLTLGWLAARLWARPEP